MDGFVSNKVLDSTSPERSEGPDCRPEGNGLCPWVNVLSLPHRGRHVTQHVTQQAGSVKDVLDVNTRGELSATLFVSGDDSSFKL